MTLNVNGYSQNIPHDTLTLRLLLVCHERTLKYGSVCNCTGDEGRPLGTGLQEQVSNHLKLRWLRARVVSVKEKVPLDGIRYESRR